MRAILFLTALFCFASSGWAMARHFQSRGKPKPGTVVTGVAAAIFAAAHLWAILGRPLAGSLAALACYASGAILFWSAIAATRGRQLPACFQRRVPGAVINGGPYRFIRHPFYVSYEFVWLGGFAATHWWPLAVSVLVMGAIYYSAARHEERDLLEGSLRADYRAYMQRTGAFLPRWRRA
jgi:protein-S-isoprenylcysteine O-methyltransferase Ste14